MAFRVVKQMYEAPSSSVSASITFTDPPWAARNVYVASSSGMPIWQFNNVNYANAKATELSDADSTDRLYKVIEV